VIVNVISEKIQEFNGKRYYLCGFYFQRNGVRLHRVVYRFNHGEIPAGYHVHHIDGNRANNDISNLEHREACEHSSEHANRPEHIAYGRMHIERIRPLASKWHGSDKGKEWHSQHGKEVMENRTDATYACTHCGREFSTKHRYGEGESTFCSNKCKSAFRRDSGIDDEQRICRYCGEAFTVNKYSKTETCNRTCAQRLRFADENKIYSLCGQN
jgi:YHS domain-containing protein